MAIRRTWAKIAEHRWLCDPADRHHMRQGRAYLVHYTGPLGCRCLLVAQLADEVRQPCRQHSQPVTAVTGAPF
jgi:hypothetical protein